MNKFTRFWDKYFFYIFFGAFGILVIAILWLFIAQPPIACTQVSNESIHLVDPEDQEKRCFNIFQMDELQEYNDYLAEKYPPPDPQDNYFIDRLNITGDSKWLND